MDKRNIAQYKPESVFELFDNVWYGIILLVNKSIHIINLYIYIYIYIYI